MPDEARMAVLRERLLERARADSAALGSYLAEPDNEGFSQIRSAAHKMAGIGPTLGFDELGRLARLVDGADHPDNELLRDYFAALSSLIFRSDSA
jgi:HPt (histidine-containing phosphotransfer) domain-containing protein